MSHTVTKLIRDQIFWTVLERDKARGQKPSNKNPFSRCQLWGMVVAVLMKLTPRQAGRLLTSQIVPFLQRAPRNEVFGFGSEIMLR